MFHDIGVCVEECVTVWVDSVRGYCAALVWLSVCCRVSNHHGLPFNYGAEIVHHGNAVS